MNSNKLTIAALLVLLVVAGGIYWLNGPQSKVKMAPVAEPALSMAAFIKHDTPQDVAAFTFVDAAGAEKDLSALKGKVTLLNLWATWCAPCRKEMPELAKLQKDMGSDQFPSGRTVGRPEGLPCLCGFPEAGGCGQPDTLFR